ncbi:B12-binding protein [Spirochaetia bacterium]|nr:B12-binding protein [Spirochaetia bacterium]
MAINYINVEKDLGRFLLGVEKPGRYTGGEYGRLAKRDADFQTAIAFPDLYEIGMSNQAMRILYNRLNAIFGISCDRVFAPAPDFEALLRSRDLPLYGLDTGIPLGNLDLLLFTLGYELGITSVLSILDSAGIPIHASDRMGGAGEGDYPVVIMGGPCVSNPLPYAPFIDAFWIGEAEAGFFKLTEELRDRKRAGQTRAELLAHIASHPSVWVTGKESAVRAIDTNFADRSPAAAVFPVPSMKVVQHHGAVEIMRGCPNGCRFCHAGYWYRPMRQKSAETIKAEVSDFIKIGGYREISLSSLSSGDYSHIDSLVESLNTAFGSRHISFQLPSLKVSTFSLPLLEKISEVRRSGLTFAVETPEEFWQHAINKEVSLQSVVSIIREAKKQGWRGVKFYFMIGLPLEELNEEEAIVDFILRAAKETNMNFNVNVGTFVPKPHTPYQRAGQLDEETAGKKLKFIREKLKSRGHKVGVQDPFVSVIEGLISRGDTRSGALIEEAWKKGCRLDAWTEFFKRDAWKEIFEIYGDYVSEIMGPKIQDLPWDCIKPGTGSHYLENEAGKSKSAEFTLPCIEKCTHPCGICGGNNKIVHNIIHDDDLLYPISEKIQENPSSAAKNPSTYKIIFSFSKSGLGLFYSHLTLIEMLSMAMVRAEIPVSYTGGFNPLPHLEIASPLAMGIAADGEIAAIETQCFLNGEEFMARMNKVLPEGIIIHEAMNFLVPSGTKKYSLSALLWGGVYGPRADSAEAVSFEDEKKYRLDHIEKEGSLYGMKRLGVLAKNQDDPAKGVPYFEAFKKLYPETGGQGGQGIRTTLIESSP